MLHESLIIPNLSRCHSWHSPQGLGLHWGTHPPACDWEHIFNFPQSCSLRALTGTHPVLRGMAQRPSVVRSTFRCSVSWALRHAMASLYPDSTQTSPGPTLHPQSVLFCEPKVSVVHLGRQQHVA